MHQLHPTESDESYQKAKENALQASAKIVRQTGHQILLEERPAILTPLALLGHLKSKDQEGQVGAKRTFYNFANSCKQQNVGELLS
jgi:hypothetical protein